MVKLFQCEINKKNCNNEHTSGAWPTIHLQSGENVSAMFTKLLSVVFANEGTLCNSCSNSTWKWSQSASNCLPAEVSKNNKK